MDQPGRPEPSATWCLIEAVVLTLVSALLVRVQIAQGGLLAGLSPAVWIYVPLLILSVRRLPLEQHGFAMTAWTRGWSQLFLSVLVVLIPYAGALHLYQWIVHEPPRLMPDQLETPYLLFNLTLVVIPEELFFRGYLQTRIAAWCELSGIRHPACPILLTAVLFAIAHLIVEPGLLRAAVFFPGLVMSWLRHRSGGLLASADFHWLANLLQTIRPFP